MQDTVKRYIETEERCEVYRLTVSPWRPEGTFKVDGIAYRDGAKGVVGGECNDHNYSGIKVWWDDNPFKGL